MTEPAATEAESLCGDSSSTGLLGPNGALRSCKPAEQRDLVLLRRGFGSLRDFKRSRQRPLALVPAGLACVGVFGLAGEVLAWDPGTH